MKKLMIVALGLAVAAVAEAGTVKWSATDISAAPGITMGEGVTYSAYFFLGDTVADATKYLAGDSKDLVAFGNAAQDTNVGSYDADKEMLSFSTKSTGSFEQGEVATGFMIIFDNADITKASNYLVAEKNGENVLSTTAFGKTGDKSLSFGTQAENTAWVKMESVPEPTSGLLLLLGVAGLALRRRRA